MLTSFSPVVFWAAVGAKLKLLLSMCVILLLAVKLLETLMWQISKFYSATSD